MTQIEMLTLANHAEAVNGLLYLTGAGWTDLRLQVGPDGRLQPWQFGVAMTLLVPWTETNKSRHLKLRVEGEDGGEPLSTVEADFETGRPPGMKPGTDQRVAFALNVLSQFPSPGGYRVVGELGDQAKSVSFRVHDVTQPGPNP